MFPDRHRAPLTRNFVVTGSCHLLVLHTGRNWHRAGFSVRRELQSLPLGEHGSARRRSRSGCHGPGCAPCVVARRQRRDLVLLLPPAQRPETNCRGPALPPRLSSPRTKSVPSCLHLPRTEGRGFGGSAALWGRAGLVCARSVPAAAGPSAGYSSVCSSPAPARALKGCLAPLRLIGNLSKAPPSPLER